MFALVRLTARHQSIKSYDHEPSNRHLIGRISLTMFNKQLTDLFQYVIDALIT